MSKIPHFVSKVVSDSRKGSEGRRRKCPPQCRPDSPVVPTRGPTHPDAALPQCRPDSPRVPTRGPTHPKRCVFPQSPDVSSLFSISSCKIKVKSLSYGCLAYHGLVILSYPSSYSYYVTLNFSKM